MILPGGLINSSLMILDSPLSEKEINIKVSAQFSAKKNIFKVAYLVYIHFIYLPNIKAHILKSWFLNDSFNKTFNFANLFFTA